MSINSEKCPICQRLDQQYRTQIYLSYDDKKERRAEEEEHFLEVGRMFNNFSFASSVEIRMVILVGLVHHFDLD